MSQCYQHDSYNFTYTIRCAFIHATLDSAVFSANHEIKIVIEVQTLKLCVFPLHVDSGNVFSLFCKYFEKLLPLCGMGLPFKIFVKETSCCCCKSRDWGHRESIKM